MAEEHLLNIREAAEFLAVSERQIKELVDKGEIPAYKIGGTFLRFKKSQLVIHRSSRVQNKRPEPSVRAQHQVHTPSSAMEGLKDFLYFNDFYIFSIIVIFIALGLIIAT